MHSDPRGPAVPGAAAEATAGGEGRAPAEPSPATLRAAPSPGGGGEERAAPDRDGRGEERAATAAPERRTGRLHPWSWLFALLTSLRQFAFPLVAVVFLGQGSGWELWGALGGVGIALYSIVYAFGFRYELAPTEIVVREGVLARTERHVPYERIQNVVQKRNVLHRMFGVTELVLESAGSGKPEAKMSVITVAEAARIERVLRGHGVAPESGEPGEAADAAPPPLLALAPRDLVRLGLVSNRGAVVVGAIFALFAQAEPWESGYLRDAFKVVRRAFSLWADAFAGSAAMVASVLGAAVLFVVVMKALSIVVAFLQFHGFTLSRLGERVTTASGLLTRSAASARRDKIQRLVHTEGWLARRMGRRSLQCDVAAGGRAGSGDGERTRLKWLAPIARTAEIDAIVAEVAPGLDLGGLEWRPLHPRAWRRMFRPALVFWTLAAIAPAWWYGAWVAGPWALLVAYSWCEARGSARFAGYAITGDVLAYRAGWLTRHWAIARIAKGQAVKLARGPFDRRAGMASVALDTAGAGMTAFPLRVPYLGEDEARALAAHLRARCEGA